MVVVGFGITIVGREGEGPWSRWREPLAVLAQAGGLASADGTRVPPAPSITDASGSVWTMVASGACRGAASEVRRNGSRPRSGRSTCGTEVLLARNVVYVRGRDAQWYDWSGSEWRLFGAIDPLDVSPSPTFTTGGVPLPTGWSLRVSDRFGTGPSQTVPDYATLHAKYYEAAYYNRWSDGLVRLPNVVTHSEQQTYVHFEESMRFYTDHLTIEARGRPDGSITSGELVSRYHTRSFCVEARYRIPNVPYSWTSFWHYGDDPGHDDSEIDVEQPVIVDTSHALQGVHDVTMYNTPRGIITVADPLFTTTWMTWTNPAFDASAAPHVYTTCYDDSGNGLTTRYIDGRPIYSSIMKWNASLGGTGRGPDASTIFNLAVGGVWTSMHPNPSTFYADLDLFSLEYYGPP